MCLLAVISDERGRAEFISTLFEPAQKTRENEKENSHIHKNGMTPTRKKCCRRLLRSDKKGIRLSQRVDRDIKAFLKRCQLPSLGKPWREKGMGLTLRV